MKITLKIAALLFLLFSSCTQADNVSSRQTGNLTEHESQPGTPGAPGTIVGIWIYVDDNPQLAGKTPESCKLAQEANNFRKFKNDNPENGRAGIHDALYAAWRQHLETWAM